MRLTLIVFIPPNTASGVTNPMAVNISPGLLFFCAHLSYQRVGSQSKMISPPTLDLVEIRIIIILIV